MLKHPEPLVGYATGASVHACVVRVCARCTWCVYVHCVCVCVQLEEGIIRNPIGIHTLAERNEFL